MREPVFPNHSALLLLVTPKVIIFLRKGSYEGKYKIAGLSRKPDYELLSILKDDNSYTWIEILEVFKRMEISSDFSSRMFPIEAMLGIHKIENTRCLLYAARKRDVANIMGRRIHRIDEIRAIRISPSRLKGFYEEKMNKGERWIQGERHLGRNFYYSHDYDITRGIQSDLCSEININTESSAIKYGNMYAWNSSIISALPTHIESWAVRIIYGYVVQEVILGDVQVTIIARRSKHNAGTRLIRRGIDENGYVANEVETEQILCTTGPEVYSNTLKNYPIYTSYVQVRGSIPLFWKNDISSLSTRYPVRLTGADVYCESASKHFENLIARYGTPITVLNLIRVKEKQPRESVLQSPFERTIDYLNRSLRDEHKIKYVSCDMALTSESKLLSIARDNLKVQKIFKYSPAAHSLEARTSKTFCTLQNGVIRTNCLDCSDRTNAAQLIIGEAAFLEQLSSLGILNKLDKADIAAALYKFEVLYNKHGNTIALQYGGSNLVKTIENFSKANNPIVQHGNLVEIIMRGYSNIFTDRDKQKVIDDFLNPNENYETPKQFSATCVHPWLPYAKDNLFRHRECSVSQTNSPNLNSKHTLHKKELFESVYSINQITFIQDSPTYRCMYECIIDRVKRAVCKNTSELVLHILNNYIHTAFPNITVMIRSSSNSSEELIMAQDFNSTHESTNDAPNEISNHSTSYQELDVLKGTMSRSIDSPSYRKRCVYRGVNITNNLPLEVSNTQTSDVPINRHHIFSMLLANTVLHTN